LETLLRKLAHGLFEWRMYNEECRILNAMRNKNLQVRTKQFALQVIAFCEKLPSEETSRILQRQLLRAGTSVGANYRAACRAKSKPAFVSKMGDVLEEADECSYWIELLIESGKAEQNDATPLMNEANELVAICISSINTAKRNLTAGD
jgi:four helix bundle protein